MKQLSKKKILLLSPSFFHYENKIMDKMTEMGAIVDFYDERSITKSIDKALLKISPKIFYNKSVKYYKKILSDNKNKNYDYILIIKCDMIPSKILKEMRKTFPNSKMILYLWDSIKNIPDIKNKFTYFDSIKSFDLNDCKNNKNLIFRPLFFTDEYKKDISNNKKYKYDISFLGTIHSDRFKIIKEIDKLAKKKQLNVYWFKYLQSNFIYYFYKLTKKEFWSTSKSDFDYNKMNGNEIAEIVADSQCILDIQHPKQTGLTMRTIEMIGMQKKIITTNSNIKDYDFYNPNNIEIIDRNNIKIDEKFLLTPYEILPQNIYNKYSLESWINDILE